MHITRHGQWADMETDAGRGMENALYIGLSRQVVLQRQLSVIANNIANADTPGYKAQRMQFGMHLVDAGRDRPNRDPDMAMVIDRSVLRDTRPGAMERTGDPMNLAIQGDGYLVVETEFGPRYTRAGRLGIDAEGRLVDNNRLPILGDDDKPIQVPAAAGTLVIAPDGSISGEQGPIGRLKVVTFEREGEMKPLGGGLLASNEAPTEAEGVQIAQGMLEGSNVQAILEMTRMIEISRQYQSTQKLLQDEHNRQRDSISRLAGTSQR